MSWTTKIILLLCSSTTAAIIYTKLPKPNEFEQRLVGELPSSAKIVNIDVVEIPDAHPIQFFHLKYSLSENCEPCSHVCYLVQNNVITPFYAKWMLLDEKPSTAGGVCEMVGHDYCQNFLKGTTFMYGMFKQFYLEMTLGEHPKFQDCLMKDLKARVRLLNPGN